MKNRGFILNNARAGLSETTFELFSCIYLKITDKIDSNNIKISNNFEKDYIQIELDSASNNKLKFSINFFEGLSDFFVDDGIEVFIQKRFLSIDKAENYFKNCLNNFIRKDIYLSEHKEISKTVYYLINDFSEKLLCGETNIANIFKKQRNKKSVLFEPWIT